MMKNTLEDSFDYDRGIILPRKRLIRPVTFIWLPGCWKNTQGKILQENFWIAHVDFWESRRKISAWNHDIAEAIRMSRISHRKNKKFDIGFRKEYIHMILEWNNVQDEQENIILDGAIRDNVWFEAIQSIFGDPYFVFFCLSRKTSHKRMKMRNERITDRKIGARHGRILAFNARTIPIIQEAHKQNRVIHIDAEKSIEAIHHRMLDRMTHEWVFEWHTPSSTAPKKKTDKRLRLSDRIKNLYFSKKRLLLASITSYLRVGNNAWKTHQ